LRAARRKVGRPMNPSQAMGTFLRVWRREWAGLSREQLAIAVAARAPKAKVTRYVVRKWEEGQPPHSTAELEALLAVMQRHGVTRWEAEDFRKAVLASCASRQYPELFSEDGFAYREDVDELARGRAWAEHGVVGLLACLKEVDEAVRGEQRPRVDWRQARRQQAALGYLGMAIASAHVRANRPALGVSAAARTADHLAAYFGQGGLGAALPVGHVRYLEVYAEIRAAERTPCTPPDIAALRVRRCAQLEEGARIGGDDELAWHLRALRLAKSHHLPADEARGLLREGERGLPACQQIGGETLVLRMHESLFACSLNLGLLHQAERHLLGCERLAVVDPFQWVEVCSLWALGVGDSGEAQTWCERYLRMAEDMRNQALTSYGLQKLEACEKLQRRPRAVSIAK
jgi:hypothetical protein